MRRYQSYQHFYAAYDLTHVYARAIGTGKPGAENATCMPQQPQQQFSLPLRFPSQRYDTSSLTNRQREPKRANARVPNPRITIGEILKESVRNITDNRIIFDHRGDGMQPFPASFIQHASETNSRHSTVRSKRLIPITVASRNIGSTTF